MVNYRIAVIPGDGIGKEVVPEGIRVLDAVAGRHGIRFQWDELPWSCETYARTGRRFTYCRKPRRIGMSSPQSETWSGTPGKPTAPRKIASCRRIDSRPSFGIISPCFA